MKLVKDGVELEVGAILGIEGDFSVMLEEIKPEIHRIVLSYVSDHSVATRECLPEAIGAQFVEEDEDA